MMVAMERPVGPWLRWSRAAALAAVAFLAGVLAHASAGGLMPGRVALVLLFAVCLLTAATLLGRPASTLRIVVLLIAGQTFIHGALTAMAGHKGDPPLARSPVPQPIQHLPVVPSGDGRRVGSLYDQLYASQPHPATQLTVPAPVQHLIADMTGPHALMALAHLAAAAVVGLWLALGERALWTVLALMSDGVRVVVAATVVAYYAILALLAGSGHESAADARAPSCGYTTEELPPRVRALARILVRRGPPLLLPA
jgi:hypothetical protein